MFLACFKPSFQVPGDRHGNHLLTSTKKEISLVTVVDHLRLGREDAYMNTRPAAMRKTVVAIFMRMNLSPALFFHRSWKKQPAHAALGQPDILPSGSEVTLDRDAHLFRGKQVAVNRTN